jgi:uncharacterized protein (TIGR02996 family)
MSDELAFLRAIAFNPYDDAIRGAYADWLDDRGRGEEAARIRLTFLRPNLRPANWMTNAELVGKLLGFPLDAGVIYTACSDYSTLRPDEVTLIRAEDRRVVFREQNGFMGYDPIFYEETVSESARRLAEYKRQTFPNEYPAAGEKPDFRTVVHFPGN